MKNILYILLLGLLAGCSGGAVVFVPTPLPPDVSPTVYQHPSGVFSIVLPRNWSIYEQKNETIASASFAPPNGNLPLVNVAVVRLGQDISLDQFGELMLQYQTQVRPDLAQYVEQDRQAMGDGSWRITGIRTVEGKPQALNTFFQRSGSLFSVMDVVIPTDAALASDVQLFVNTLVVNDAQGLATASLSALSGVATAGLQIEHVLAWTTQQGVFYITGEVVNRSNQVLFSPIVQASLLGENQTVLAEANDVLMGHAIEPNGYAPFSLRFGEGQPLGAVDFALSVSNNPSIAEGGLVISAPSLVWTDAQQRGTDRQLYISGTVTNNGTNAVTQGIAVVTIFDADGNVIGAGFSPIQEATLNPKQTSDFVVLVSDLGGEPINYIVNIQALPK